MRSIIKIYFNSNTMIFALLLTAFISFLSYNAFFGKDFYNRIVNKHTNEDTIRHTELFLEENGFDQKAFFKQYPSTPLQVTSSDKQYSIPGTLFLTDKNNNNDTVLLIHGIGYTSYQTLPIAAFFLEAGYNIVMYDQRASGINDVKHNTYGFLESKDYIDYVSAIRQRIGRNPKLFVWGIDTGAATIMIGSERVQHQVNGLFLDTPFLAMREVVLDDAATAGQGFIGRSVGSLTADINLRSRHGFGLLDMYLPEYLVEYEIPALYLTNKNEQRPGYQNIEEILDYDWAEVSRVVTFDAPQNGDLFQVDKQAYEEAILSFIDDIR